MEIENSASCGSGGVGQIGKGKASAGYIRGFSDLDVYQEAYRGMLMIFKRILPSIPKEERFDLLDQLRRSSKAIPRLIAEGAVEDKASARTPHIKMCGIPPTAGPSDRESQK
jgi:hypothetical protein